MMLSRRGWLGVRSSNHVSNGPIVLCCYASRWGSVGGQMMMELKSQGVGVAGGRGSTGSNDVGVGVAGAN